MENFHEPHKDDQNMVFYIIFLIFHKYYFYITIKTFNIDHINDNHKDISNLETPKHVDFLKEESEKEINISKSISYL